jgi:phosphoglycerate kinase
MAKKTIEDIDVSGKRVLVRVDFNVPLEGRRITDDTRLRAALPTIRYLTARQAKVILLSHLGRPKGVEEGLRLDPVARRLGELLGQPVSKADDCIGPEVEAAVARLRPGEVLLLENVRFHPEEEKGEEDFARKLAALADVYVNDAFGTAHRAHASTTLVAHYLPAVAGFLLKKELEALGGALESPRRPFVAILGGAKVADKIPVVENLIPRVNALLIGGGMAYTFLAAKGLEVGKSLLNRESIGLCRKLLQQAGEAGIRLELPLDVVVTPELKEEAPRKTVSVDQIPPDWIGADIGPDTVRLYGSIICEAKTIVWNGPMGVFEIPPLAAGTLGVARAMAESGATTIVGGGDSAAALEQLGLADRMTHISTGGGASLEFLEGKKLPGVEALNDK